MKIINYFKLLFRYGSKAGEYETPTGCQLADYTCDVVFVKSSNTSQPCFDLESDSSESI